MGSQGNTALTLDDFLALCEAAPEGVRYECVGGRAVMMASPSHQHQFALGELAALLRDGVPPGLVVLQSPVDWVLWEVPLLTLRQPDLVVIGRDQFGRSPLTSPPVVVVEVLSPTTRAVDLRNKRAEYARAGARHYWVVDVGTPAVEAYVLGADGYELAARAEGTETAKLTEPFPVTVTPADLLLA
jgi:Uma2 family endonuclease